MVLQRKMPSKDSVHFNCCLRKPSQGLIWLAARQRKWKTLSISVPLFESYFQTRTQYCLSEPRWSSSGATWTFLCYECRRAYAFSESKADTGSFPRRIWFLRFGRLAIRKASSTGLHWAFSLQASWHSMQRAGACNSSSRSTLQFSHPALSSCFPPSRYYHCVHPPHWLYAGGPTCTKIRT